MIPLLIAMGGNTGSQISAMLIGAWASKDISLSEWKRVLRKEFLFGTLLAIILSVLGWVFGYLRGGFDIPIAFLVGISVALIAFLSNILGTLIPGIGIYFHLDPALLCGPLITTIMDILGLVIYFGLASAILASN
jgi:magnesium transporter